MTTLTSETMETYRQRIADAIEPLEFHADWTPDEAPLTAAEALDEIRESIAGLLDAARTVLRDTAADYVRARSEAYWFAQMRIALDGGHGYMGGCPCTLADTIAQLEEQDADSEPEHHAPGVR